MSQRQRILKELGLTPLWQLRGAEQPAPAAQEPEVAAPVEAMVSAAPTPASRSAPKVATTATPSRNDSSDALPAWLDDEIPLPDLLPPLDHDELDTAPATAKLSRESRIAALDWQGLQTDVATCRACELCKTRRNTVFGVGDAQADWLIVGEAPGADEDLQGEPFVGQAGKLLDNMLKALDLQRGHGVFIANVLKCRPPQNRDPNPQETAQCEPYLLRQIELIKPKIIVAVGRIAAQSLLKNEAKIGSLRGKVHSYHGVPLIITYHPAYLLRSPAEKAKAWQDLCLARATYRQLSS